MNNKTNQEPLMLHAQERIYLSLQGMADSQLRQVDREARVY